MKTEECAFSIGDTKAGVPKPKNTSRGGGEEPLHIVVFPPNPFSLAMLLRRGPECVGTDGGEDLSEFVARLGVGRDCC